MPRQLIEIEASSTTRDSFLTLSTPTYKSLLGSTNTSSPTQILQLIHPGTSKWIFLMSFSHLRHSRQNIISDKVLSRFNDGYAGASPSPRNASSSLMSNPAAALNANASHAVSSTHTSQKYHLNLIYNGPGESIDNNAPTHVEQAPLASNLQIIWNVHDLIVKPCSDDDYEILELNEKKIAEQMLNQHRVFTKDMVFPFWVDENLVIYLQVVGTTHEKWNYNSFVYVIGRKTEFLIDRLSKGRNGAHKMEKSRLFFEKTIKELNSVILKSTELEPLSGTRCIAVEEQWAQSMGFENGDIVELFQSVRFVPPQQQASILVQMGGQSKLRRTRKTTFAVMHLVSQQQLPFLNEHTIGVSQDLITEMDCQHHSRVFFRYSNLTTRQNVTSIFLYRLLEDTPARGMNHNQDDNIELTPESATKLLRDYIARHKNLASAEHVPFCSRGIVQLTPTTRCLISFNTNPRSRPALHQAANAPVQYTDFSDPAIPIMGNLFLLDEQKLEQLNVSTPAETFQVPRTIHPHMDRFSTTYEHHSTPFKQLKHKLKSQLHEPCFFSSKVSYSLISGDAGNGKTTAAHSLCVGLDAHRIFISCNQLIGERADHIMTILKARVADAMSHSPSIIVFDDLDTICPLEQEDGPPDMNIRLLTSSLIDMLTLIIKRGTESKRLHNIACVFTAQSIENLHMMIQDAEMFENQLYLSTPAELLRRHMLQDIWHTDHASWTVTDTLIGYMCLKTEGYSVQDLKNICDQTVKQQLVNQMLSTSIEGKVQSPNPSKVITQDAFDEAASSYVRQAEEGIKLVKSKATWEDVGGLKDVIRTIQETFEYPGKYPAFFKKTPLKLRSGLLLYGPTGCGKTHVANVAAGACGLNFISVKGPEILNKYIGQSEENVRKLFRQAEAAKPCIIFFDEFDSIAASRGKDTTGVTDRVVNQFLCQMDGVESRDGVYVLAATSRPDLIDAALLRPGRLDKALLCGFPSAEDRLDILRVLTRKVLLDMNVDLKEIANITENWTGADLQGLLTNASIIAAHEAEHEMDSGKSDVHDTTHDAEQQLLHIDSNVKSNALTEDSLHVFDTLKAHLKSVARQEQNESNTSTSVQDVTEVRIRRSHILEALEESQPSVGIEERLRLEYIYEQFRDGKKANAPGDRDPLRDLLREQHVTLA